MSTPSFIESTLVKQDIPFEVPLRPQSLNDFTGQDDILKRLRVMIGAAKLRNEPLNHCLFCGPPGLGKTTLASILAKEMNSDVIITSGPTLDKPGDLAGVLTNLKTGDILFIDEIHRMNRVVEEYLYSAMDDFTLSLMLDSGPNARTVQVQLNRFTLVGATTRLGLLSAPLRSRFTFISRLEYYTAETLETIICRSANVLNVSIDKPSALQIAMRARGTPRIANNLLKWVRDYAQMHSNNQIDHQMVNQAISMLNIDEIGLDEMDRKILEIIIDFYKGGPVGVKTIAVAVGEESHTIEEVYEPFLIKLGLLQRTSQGRLATPKAFKHLNKIIEGEQS